MTIGMLLMLQATVVQPTTLPNPVLAPNAPVLAPNATVMRPKVDVKVPAKVNPGDAMGKISDGPGTPPPPPPPTEHKGPHPKKDAKVGY